MKPSKQTKIKDRRLEKRRKPDKIFCKYIQVDLFLTVEGFGYS